VKINCLSCGHTVELDEAYDDYEGPVKCFACGAILDIRTDQGKVKSVSVANTMHRQAVQKTVL